MSGSADGTRSRVTLTPASREQAPVLANLLELYAHDLSAWFDLEPGADGRFGYPHLARYWGEEGRHPFLLTVDGTLAGLVLVARGSRISGDRDVWDMAEFFVLRRHRRQGVGAAAAAEAFARFPGAWEVRVHERNAPALAFWRRAIDAFTGGRASESSAEQDGIVRRVFAFSAAKDGERGSSDGVGDADGRGAVRGR